MGNPGHRLSYEDWHRLRKELASPKPKTCREFLSSHGQSFDDGRSWLTALSDVMKQKGDYSLKGRRMDSLRSQGYADVILESHTQDFLVRARMLCAASEVFAAQLASRFAEGVLEANGKRRIRINDMHDKSTVAPFVVFLCSDSLGSKQTLQKLSFQDTVKLMRIANEYNFIALEDERLVSICRVHVVGINGWWLIYCNFG